MDERLEAAAMAILLQAVPHGDGHTLVANRHIKALADALKPNQHKDSEVARSYGKCWQCGYLGFDVEKHACTKTRGDI